MTNTSAKTVTDEDIRALERKVAAEERALARAQRDLRNRGSHTKYQRAVHEAEKRLHIVSTQRMSAMLEKDLQEVARLHEEEKEASQGDTTSFSALVEDILALNPHVKKSELLQRAEFDAEEPLWDLSDLDLVKLPESFGKCKFETSAGRALSLILDHNRLKTLPESISQLQIHADLLLNHNKIESLPESFSELGWIPRNLNLMANNLTTLQYPGLFGNDGLGPSEAMWEAVAAQRTGTSDAPFDLPILGSLSLGEGLQAAVRNYMAFPSLVRFNPSLFGNMPVDIFMEGSSLSPLSCPLAPPQPLLSPP